MATWTNRLKTLTDRAILDGRTDPEVAAMLEAQGLDHNQALFRSANRRSKLLKRGENVVSTVVTEGAAAPADVDAIRELVRLEVAAMPTLTIADAQSMFRDILSDYRPPAAVSQTLTIVLPDGATKKIDGAHYLMPRLLRLMGAGIPVYLWGPAGTGKTTAALSAAEALGGTAEIDTLDPSTFRSMVQGYRTPEGEPVHTAFTRCWCEGKTYVADEVDNAPGHVQTLFNSALANGHAPLAWGAVERGTGFAFVGTGNTPGRPTRAFPDRRPMSAAFADRLYFVYWPLDESIEARAVGDEPLPPPVRRESSCSPRDWRAWVRRVREWCADNAPTIQVTPRATLVGIRALAIGETPEEIADGLVFRGCDDELRRKVLNACPLPTDESESIPESETTADVMKYRVAGTKFTDYESRGILRRARARWNKDQKIWTAPLLSPDDVAALRSRGCTVEVA